MTGQTIGPYHVGDKLGEGGMGIVFRALDTSLQRPVALKFLPPQLSEDPEAKRRFVREAQTASALDHPNICTIHQIGETEDGRLYIVMPLYEGETLKYRLRKDAPLAPSVARYIARQLADGLSAAHASGIVHRDIKPANLMLLSGDRVKILDFGVAKLEAASDLTQAGSTVGTASYMSPEQTRGDEVDARADLWSLGVVLYEMLTGESPFGAAYGAALSYAILNEDPTPVAQRNPAIDAGLSALVQRLLSKEPADRHPTAEAVSAALGGTGVQETTASHDSTAGPGAGPGAGQRARASAGISAPSATAATRTKTRRLLAIAGSVLAVVVVMLVARGMVADDERADAAPSDAVAIMPFTISGPQDLAYLGEGMVNLLGGLLDGAGTIRTVDPNLVLSVTRDQPFASPTEAARLTAQMGGSKFVLGSLTQVGSEKRFLARVYGPDGVELGSAASAYRSDDEMIGAIDALAGQLVGTIFDQPAEQLGSLAANTTHSFQALREYLLAEAFLRQTEPLLAGAAARRALAYDSTFALAWYARAVGQYWDVASMDSARFSLAAALRHSAHLNEATRDLIRAELAFFTGDPDLSESLMNRRLQTNPNDLRALALLAEVYTHNTRHGVDRTPLSSRMDAINLIERIRVLDPGNSQLVSHHLAHVLFLCLRQGSFRRIDSLAAVLADLPIPAPGERLDWSKVGDRVNEGQLESLLPLIMAFSDPDAIRSRRQTLREEALRSGGFSILYTDAQSDGLFGDYSMEVLEALPPVRGYADSLRQHLQRSGTFALQKYYLGRGYYARFLDLMDRTPDSSPLYEALAWSLTLASPAMPLEVFEDRLRTFEATLVAWNPSTQVMPAGAFMTPTPDAEAVGWYIIATLRRRLGDNAGFEEASARLAQSEAVRRTDPTAVALDSELAGLNAWAAGDLSSAATLISASLMSFQGLKDGGFDPLLGRPQPGWYLAALYREMGRTDDAHAWLADPTGFVAYADFASSRIQEARWFDEDEDGDKDRAVLFYSQAIQQWQEADPSVQHVVQEARDRVAALLRAGAREPGLNGATGATR